MCCRFSKLILFRQAGGGREQHLGGIFPIQSSLAANTIPQTGRGGALRGDCGFVTQEFQLPPYRRTRLTELHLLEKFGVGMNAGRGTRSRSSVFAFPQLLTAVGTTVDQPGTAP